MIEINKHYMLLTNHKACLNLLMHTCFNCIYSLFHKTLPKSILKMRWISVRFYEMGDIQRASWLISVHSVYSSVNTEPVDSVINFEVTWNDCDSLERPEDPEGAEGGQVAQVYTHSQVPKLNTDSQVPELSTVCFLLTQVYTHSQVP